MTVAVDQELFFVGENLTKEDAYAAKREGVLRRISQGVYVRSDQDIDEAFSAFALRICKKRYPDVALTHATAWWKAPTGEPHALRVFVGGDYPHKSPFRGVNRAGELEEAYIVQTAVWPDFTDPMMYERVTISDPKGEFEMWSSTLELQVLQQMDATKVHPEKHLPESTLDLMWRQLQDKHGDAALAWNVIKEVSKRGKKPKKYEAKRFGGRFYQDVLRDIPFDDLVRGMSEVLDTSNMSRDGILRNIIMMDDTTRNKIVRIIIMRDLLTDISSSEWDQLPPETT
ncbi:MAG: hypothetical protein WKF61_05785 [Luteimonas sp.]